MCHFCLKWCWYICICAVLLWQQRGHPFLLLAHIFHFALTRFLRLMEYPYGNMLHATCLTTLACRARHIEFLVHILFRLCLWQSGEFLKTCLRKLKYSWLPWKKWAATKSRLLAALIASWFCACAFKIYCRLRMQNSNYLLLLTSNWLPLHEGAT